MLPALAGMAVKALLPSGKKVDKDKLLNKKESSAIQKVDDEKSVEKAPIVQRKTISTNLLLPPAEIKEPPTQAEVSKGGNLKDIFGKIGETLQGIINALSNRNENQKEEEENKKEQAKVDEKKEREETLEKKSKKKPPKKSGLKLPKDPFNLMGFFGNVLLGSIALAIFKNLEEIIEFFKNVYKQVTEFFKKLGEFLEPLWNGFKWVVGEGTKLVGQLLGIPKENLDEKDILKNLNEIKDKIPGLKQLFEGINNTIESLRSGRGLDSGQPASGGGPSSYTPGSIPQSVSQDTEFTSGVTELAKKYNVPEDYLYAVMGFETGGTFDPAQKNIAGSGATGLIQFMPSTAKGLGTTTEALSKMSRVEQLKYVDKYFSTKGIEGGSLSDIYMSVLLPAAVGKPEDFVLFGDGGAYGGQRAYEQNKGLDLNKDGKITKAEATSKVSEYLPQGFTPTPSSTQPQISEQAKEIQDTGTYTVAGVTYNVETGAPVQTQAQVAPTQPAPPVSASVPQIMQQAEYEIPGGTPSSTIVPIPMGGGSSPMMIGGGGTRLLPVGVSKQALLNSYYQAQLTGFLYKQG